MRWNTITYNNKNFSFWIQPFKCLACELKNNANSPEDAYIYEKNLRFLSSIDRWEVLFVMFYSNFFPRWSTLFCIPSQCVRFVVAGFKERNIEEKFFDFIFFLSCFFIYLFRLYLYIWRLDFLRRNDRTLENENIAPWSCRRDTSPLCHQWVFLRFSFYLLPLVKHRKLSFSIVVFSGELLVFRGFFHNF